MHLFEKLIVYIFSSSSKASDLLDILNKVNEDFEKYMNILNTELENNKDLTIDLDLFREIRETTKEALRKNIAKAYDTQFRLFRKFIK